MIGVLPPAARRRSFCSGCVPTSLRLRSTFPFAEPQAEALQNLLGNAVQACGNRGIENKAKYGNTGVH
jgi:hypothetical protein